MRIAVFAGDNLWSGNGGVNDLIGVYTDPLTFEESVDGDTEHSAWFQMWNLETGEVIHVIKEDVSDFEIHREIANVTEIDRGIVGRVTAYSKVR